ncbi:MAG: nuclease domain-containing protein [candidate division WOR-3 bacterium]
MGSEVEEIWFNEVVDELKKIWHKIFYKDFKKSKLSFKGERTKLSTLMLWNYKKERFFEKIFKYINYLTKSHHFEIALKETIGRPEEFKYLKPYSYTSLILAKNNPSLKIKGIEKKLSILTNENIFVAAFLEKIIRDLKDKRIEIEDKVKKLKENLNSNDDKKEMLNKLEEILSYIDEYIKKFRTLRFSTFLSEIPSNLSFPEYTQRLYYLPVYRKIWDCFRKYARTLLPDDIGSDLSLIASWRIYELWVLFSIKKILNEILGECEINMIKIEEEKILIDEGKAELKDVFDNNSIIFWWNKGFYLEYQKYIGKKTKPFVVVSEPVRPDVVFYNIKNPENFFIFEAKEMNFKSLLNEDIEKKRKSAFEQMHIYRDNIITDNFVRPTKLATILFSGKEENSKLIYKGDFEYALKKGIIAINLRTDKDKEKLKDLLSKIIKNWR